MAFHEVSAEISARIQGLEEWQLATRSTWVRLQVAWPPNVQAIHHAERLCLDEPQPAPQRPTAREKNLERWRQRFGRNLRCRL